MDLASLKFCTSQILIILKLKRTMQTTVQESFRTPFGFKGRRVVFNNVAFIARFIHLAPMLNCTSCLWWSLAVPCPMSPFGMSFKIIKCDTFILNCLLIQFYLNINRNCFQMMYQKYILNYVWMRMAVPKRYLLVLQLIMIFVYHYTIHYIFFQYSLMICYLYSI